MSSLMQIALGEHFNQLPKALQAHYKTGPIIEEGVMDISYPRWMQPILSILYLFGALVNKSGRQVVTRVQRSTDKNGEIWQRQMHYTDGKKMRFNSYWLAGNNNHIIEYINSVLGHEMAVWVEHNKLYYLGKRYIVKLGPVLIPIPQWLLLGVTHIVEEAIDERHYAMDFRLIHPLFGQVFRYAGQFAVEPYE